MAVRASFVINVKNKIMQKILSLLLISFLTFSCTNTFHNSENFAEEKVSSDFVQGSEDVPLLVGMEKISDDSLGFDSPAGSIMASSYETKSDLERIKNFYQKTLPQMGWDLKKSDIAKLKFERDKEKLEIEFVNQNGQDLVRFFLSSAL
jgi:hypothetical protein